MKRPDTIFVGCGVAKAAIPCPAASMYNGSLFAQRRRYAESIGCGWYVLSARYGLVAPHEIIVPYDMRIQDMCQADQVGWALSIARDFMSLTSDTWRRNETVVEIHAGEAYASTLADILIACGISAHWPMKGLSQGEQMAWYSTKVKTRAA